MWRRICSTLWRSGEQSLLCLVGSVSGENYSSERECESWETTVCGPWTLDPRPESTVIPHDPSAVSYFNSPPSATSYFDFLCYLQSSQSITRSSKWRISLQPETYRVLDPQGHKTACKKYEHLHRANATINTLRMRLYLCFNPFICSFFSVPVVRLIVEQQIGWS